MVAKLAVRYPEFGRRVKVRAREKGLQIADVKRGLNVTYEMARRYWEGIAKPRTARMHALAILLGCPVGWLEYGEEPQAARRNDTADGDEVPLAEEAREIARVFQMLSPTQKDFYRSQMFRDAALSKVAPWLKAGRPAGEHYDRYERSMERDFEKRVRQLQLNLEAK